MKLAGTYNELKLKLEVAPLIDVVFLLLIYFMVTTALIKKEADIGFIMPEIGGEGISDVPVEVLIQIGSDGAVELGGIKFSGSDLQLKDLSGQIAGLKKLAEWQGSVFFVNLLPDGEAKHSRIIDVIDACAKAGVENPAFSKSG